MVHVASKGDREFRQKFESGQLQPSEFGHRAHVRLACVYLTECDPDSAHQAMQQGLLRFLTQHGVDVSKCHETMTRAWILAVRHFMEKSADSTSADEFIAQNPQLLDSKIMLTHYSAEVLFSAEARARFVAPDMSPIPDYHGQSES